MNSTDNLELVQLTVSDVDVACAHICIHCIHDTYSSHVLLVPYKHWEYIMYIAHKFYVTLNFIALYIIDV